MAVRLIRKIVRNLTFKIVRIFILSIQLNVANRLARNRFLSLETHLGLRGNCGSNKSMCTIKLLGSVRRRTEKTIA